MVVVAMKLRTWLDSYNTPGTRVTVRLFACSEAISGHKPQHESGI